MLAIACLDIATGLEHWPFGSYPMYSLLYNDQCSLLRLYGITREGEIPLRAETAFPPFDTTRLSSALARVLRQGDKGRTRQALRNLFELNSAHSKPQLQGLRLYSETWVLRAGLTGTEPPQGRALIAEYRKQ